MLKTTVVAVEVSTYSHQPVTITREVTPLTAYANGEDSNCTKLEMNIDVRSPSVFAAWHMGGAINIPVAQAGSFDDQRLKRRVQSLFVVAVVTERL